ncbi:cell surface glycoprotein 2 [Clostridiales bacterium]|nr:cell surface glycoprotein 2 [Clostridiales bacterium]
MKKRKCVTLAAAVAMAAIMSSTAFAAPSDISGHWAQSAINSWTSMGYISGYPDGTFKPDNQITRAEFVVLVNKAMRFSIKANSSFNDVGNDYWGHDEIMKAVAAGYITGDGNGTFRPNDPVRRQEAAVMIAKVKSLGTDASGTYTYADSGRLPNWASGYIGAVSKAGIMSGYPDGEFKADRTLTRAEAVVALNSAMNYVKPSTYQPPQQTVKPTQPSTVISDDYTLESSSLSDRVVTGDLIISSKMANRSVSLDNVTVNGKLIVNGGGTITADDCDIFALEMDKTDATFKATGTTTVDRTTFERAGKIMGDGFDNVLINNKLSTSITIDAEVKSLELDAETNLKLLSDADIKYFDVTNNADRATVNFNSAEVRTMDVHDKIRITGRGDIGTMNVYTSGISSSIKPDTVNRHNGASNPSYTSNSSGSSSSSGSSRYDDYTVTKDRAKIKNEKFDDLKIKGEDVTVSDTTVYGNLTIDSSVGDEDATFNDVTVRGNVYIYGGGEDTVEFYGCDIRGDVIIDKSRGDTVRVYFRGSTNVDGDIKVRCDSIVESSKKLSKIIMDDSDAKLELRANVATLNINRKGDLKVKNGYTIDRVNVSGNADNTEISVESSATIKNLDTGSKITLLGSGTVSNKTTSGNGSINSSGGISDGVAVTGVTLNKDTISLKPGASERLSATVKPDNATDKSVTWSSDKPAVATVSSDGTVKAVANGTAKITATASGKTAVCTVTVSADGGSGDNKPTDPDNPNPPVEEGSVTLDKTSLKLNMSGTNIGRITATVNTTTGTGGTVAWSISNKDSSSSKTIATLSKNGNTVTVTGLNVGEATITATFNGKSASCDLTVENVKVPIKVEGVTIKPTSLTLEVGETSSLEGSVSPTDADNQGVTWASTDETVASVDDKGKVTALKAGSTNIIVTAAEKGPNGEIYSKVCAVTVKEATVYATGITAVGDTSLTLMVNGDTGEGQNPATGTLSAKVSPDNATDKTVTWTSSNDEIATVSGSGVSNDGVATVTVTAVSNGTAKITAVPHGAAKDTDIKSVEYTITVKANPNNKVDVTGVSIIKGQGSVTGFELEEGDHVALTAEIVPNNATEKGVTWSTSDSSIVDVSADTTTGKATITAKSGKAGQQATITATSVDDSSKTATCTVTVKAKTIHVSSIEVSPSQLYLTVGGDSESLTTKVSPSNATNGDVKWVSEQPTIASVDENGNVTGNKTGTAIIRADAGGYSGRCTVYVEDPADVQSVAITNAPTVVKANTSTAFSADVTLNNGGKNSDVTWTSTPAANITGDTISFPNTGTYKVKATSIKNPAKSSPEVTVTVVDMSISTTGGANSIETGGKLVISTNAANATWEISNAGSNATLSATSGKNVTLNAGTTAGKCTVTLKVTVGSIILTETKEIDITAIAPTNLPSGGGSGDAGTSGAETQAP